MPVTADFRTQSFSVQSCSLSELVLGDSAAC